VESKPVKEGRQRQDAKQLKQRLLGAAVLVALAVIIIPELVKQPPDQVQATHVDMPPPPEMAQKPTLTVKLPEPEKPPALRAGAIPNNMTNAATAAQPDAVSADQETITGQAETPGGLVDTLIPMPATPDSRVAATPAAETTAVSEPRQPETIAATPGSVPQNTATAAASSRPLNPPPRPVGQATRETAQTTPGAVALPRIELISPRQYQTRPGNNPSPASANRPLNQTSPTQLAAVDSAATGAGSDWVVQAGSFAVASNANLLRDQLRARNFPASLRAVTVDGRTLYRVNVGPYPSRSETEQVRQRLLREARVNGSVRRSFN
jgi:cell division septation protein DedD